MNGTPTVIRDDRQALRIAVRVIVALLRINDACRAGKARVPGAATETVRANLPRLEKYLRQTISSDAIHTVRSVYPTKEENDG